MVMVAIVVTTIGTYVCLSVTQISNNSQQIRDGVRKHFAMMT